ncbi:hypothetical protein [Mesorhizobium sp.]|uniref:hypothetical protein n=1 Tax=Mesorhizobium sp. TaxID=1871066 RepID=UPI00257D52B4|nr:hypothetical protein [Mesorhizobium sp.]
MPQITARLIPSTAIMKTAMAASTPRNMRAKCIGSFAQIGFEGANAEASEDCLDAVDDPCTFADEIVSFTVRTAGLLLIDGWDGCHAAVALLAPQSAKKGAHQQFGIEAIGLGAPMFAGNRDARWMYDISLDSVRLEPARQPKAVASSLIGDNDAPDFAPGLDGFAAPAAQQPEHRIRVGIELLERVTFKARDRRSNEPLCLAHLNHCDQRAVLIKGGKGFACIKGW